MCSSWIRTVTGCSKSFKKKYKKFFLRARAHVFQRCIGAILDEIENVAKHGFTANLGAERIRLHPFLVAIQVDSKERKTYFGLKSDRYVHDIRILQSYVSIHI